MCGRQFWMPTCEAGPCFRLHRDASRRLFYGLSPLPISQMGQGYHLKAPQRGLRESARGPPAPHGLIRVKGEAVPGWIGGVPRMGWASSPGWKAAASHWSVLAPSQQGPTAPWLLMCADYRALCPSDARQPSRVSSRAGVGRCVPVRQVTNRQDLCLPWQGESWPGGTKDRQT